MLEHVHAAAMTDETQRDTEVETWTRAFRDRLFHVLGRFPETAATTDKYLALARSVISAFSSEVETGSH